MLKIISYLNKSIKTKKIYLCLLVLLNIVEAALCIIGALTLMHLVSAAISYNAAYFKKYVFVIIVENIAHIVVDVLIEELNKKTSSNELNYVALIFNTTVKLAGVLLEVIRLTDGLIYVYLLLLGLSVYAFKLRSKQEKLAELILEILIKAVFVFGAIYIALGIMKGSYNFGVFVAIVQLSLLLPGIFTNIGKIIFETKALLDIIK